jgi:L-ascorbate metabolism protein UlaG (beta-lactamase superfamily)
MRAPVTRTPVTRTAAYRAPAYRARACRERAYRAPVFRSFAALLLAGLTACEPSGALAPPGSIDASAIDPPPPPPVNPPPPPSPANAHAMPLDTEARVDPEPIACESPSCRPPVEAAQELEIRFLGVGGFSFRAGDDVIASAPFFTNPPLNTVLTGAVQPDTAIIDRFLDPIVHDAKAILVGHAHYDHLLDVPYIWTKTAGAQIFGNISVRNTLAALAPDRGAECSTATTGYATVPREYIVTLDDPANDRVDYRLCAEPQSRCPGANDGREGEWIDVPRSHMRVRGLCSQHPDQFLVFHFGSGCIDDELCTLPERAGDWREGGTIAYLVDFLDPNTGAPIFRIYYQDAPTDAPVGHVHPDLLAEKRVDVAILCVGNYDQVTGHPTAIIEAMDPRFVIAGHWESFFRTRAEPIEDLPFHDVPAFVALMEAAMPGAPDAPVRVDGVVAERRSWLPQPGTAFVVPKEPSPMH